MNEKLWWPQSISKEYRIADYCGHPVPSSPLTDLLDIAKDPQQSLPNEFIIQFCACVWHIARCSKFESMVAKQNRRRESKRFRSDDGMIGKNTSGGWIGVNIEESDHSAINSLKSNNSMNSSGRHQHYGKWYIIT